MKILIDIAGLNPLCGQNDIIELAKRAYKSMCRPGEGHDLDSCPAYVLDGRGHPEQLKTVGTTWNRDILRMWKESLHAVEDRYSRTDESVFATPSAVGLAIDAMALADMFHPSAVRHVSFDHGPLHPYLRPTEKQSLLSYPPRFAVVEFDVVRTEG